MVATSGESMVEALRDACLKFLVGRHAEGNLKYNLIRSDVGHMAGLL
jgi:hypothetical protein